MIKNPTCILSLDVWEPEIQPRAGEPGDIGYIGNTELGKAKEGWGERISFLVEKLIK